MLRAHVDLPEVSICSKISMYKVENLRVLIKRPEL